MVNFTAYLDTFSPFRQILQHKLTNFRNRKFLLYDGYNKRGIKMKEKFLNGCISFVKNNNIEIQEEELRYGLEGIYLTFGKLLIIFPLAFLLGILKEFTLSLIFFNIIRYPAFGLHANKSSTCLISSMTLLLGIPLLLTKITITLPIKIGICIFCLVCFILYAPADTVKRPLTNERKRKLRKIAACLLAVTYSILVIVFNNNEISTYLLSGLIIETILILPVTYKLYGMPYRNYLTV